MTKKNDLDIFSIFREFLSCCHPEKENPKTEIQINRNEDDNMNYQNDEIIDGVQSLFPSKYIREDERKHLKFSRDSILNYLSELSQKNFINKYDERTLKLSILDRNELSDNTPVIRSEKILKKSLFKKGVPTLEQLIMPLLIPELRLKVDNNFSEFEIVKKINNNTQITRMVSTPQLTMISEREFYDKKTFFIEDGVFYYFCSSIPDDIYQKNKDTERALNYFGIMVIKEDVENFYIDTFNKVDIKMNIPEVLIIMSFPMKMKEFSDGLLHYFNN